ncbi:VPLPA-CTERM sorting domain-containing protein [Antarctobacter jejuensis]|uniref:VPLPA-CTERM sorting domain-containing protein n=1 Tax=Antarctobacter jejuensis TaxID=1439938 RepID=UPI003FD05D29
MKILALATALSLGAMAANAATVTPVSYDMPNGNSGSYNYWDDTYTGTGNRTVDGAALSGGTGQLTDGVIATANWYSVESPRGPNGPYVGWSTALPQTTNPVITFRFDKAYDFNSITFHFDDANGGGGVSAPRAVDVNGLGFGVADPAGSAPFAFTGSLAALGATDELTVQIFHRTSWLFLSEVTFDAEVSAVPLPASGLLLLGAFGGLAAWRRKRTA